MKAVALTDIWSSDTVTQSALGFKDIPRGSEVEVVGSEYKNLYGTYIDIKFGGYIYSTTKDRLKFLDDK